MEAFPAALATIILGLAKGAALETVLAGLSGGTWLALAEGAAGELLPAPIATKLGLAHPALKTLFDQVSAGVSAVLASQAAKDWFTANANKAMQLQPGISSES
jgi:DNA-binding helix-hairpin-helix protein with protein kinase domain